GIVLAPTFNDPNDRVALATLARLFPGRRVAGIHSLDLALGLGTVHCMTMQQPAVVQPRVCPARADPHLR
ncbi:MAG: agmatine deiminase family protein, partial [Bryobacteraceae bacterium]